MSGATWNFSCLSTSSVYTIQPCTMSLHAKTHREGVCMFSCNLPPALLSEWLESFTCYCGNTGWNGYRNKSQHRKLTPDKKILPPLLQGFEPVTFQSRVRRSNHWAIPVMLCAFSFRLFLLFREPSDTTHKKVTTYYDVTSYKLVFPVQLWWTKKNQSGSSSTLNIWEGKFWSSASFSAVSRICCISDSDSPWLVNTETQHIRQCPLALYHKNSPPPPTSDPNNKQKRQRD